MAANAVECRRRAQLCLKLARDAAHERQKNSLLAVASNWEKLARELEKAHTEQPAAHATPLFR